jgi:hypothetical protein
MQNLPFVIVERLATKGTGKRLSVASEGSRSSLLTSSH